MADAAPFDPTAQADIELPNGVVLTGVGGDVDALTDIAEDRHESRSPAVPVPDAPAVGDKPTRGQKRFQQLTQARDEAKARADAAEAKAAEAERKATELLARLQTPVVPPSAAAQPTSVAATREKPQEDQVGTKYPNYSAYVEDLADWKAEQRETALVQRLEAQTQARIEGDRAARSQADVATAAFERGRGAYTDFDAVLKQSTREIPPYLQAAILKAPASEHVLYALAKDDTLLQSVLQLRDPFEVAYRLISSVPSQPAVSQPASAPVVRTSNAPAPPQPVGAGTRTTTPTVEELASSGDFEAYQALRRKQLARR